MNDQQIAEYLRSRASVTPPLDFTRSVMAAVDAAPSRPWHFAAYIPAFVAVGAAGGIAVLALLIGFGRPAASSPPDVSAATVDALQAALTDSVDVLRSAEGVEGVGTSHVFDELGSVSWFSWRPNGDQVVVNLVDRDVTETGWWLGSGEPPSRGVNVQTQIQARVGDGYYGTVTPGAGTEDVWVSGGLPGVAYLGVPFPAALDGDVQAWQGDHILTLDGEVSVEHLADGVERWTLTKPEREGSLVLTFEIAPDGALRSVSHELVGVALAIGERPITSAMIELTVLEDPEPIRMPDVEAVPDASFFGLPSDLPLEPATPRVTPEPSPPTPVHAVQVEACAAAPAPFTVTLPEGWWTNVAFDDPEMGGVAACHYFAPTAFDATATGPASDPVFPPGVALILRFVDGGCVGSFNPQISAREATVDGHPASVVEYAWGTEADDPPGRYEYVVDLAPGVDCETGGRFILASTNIELAGDYESNKAVLDQIMSTIQIEP